MAGTLSRTQPKPALLGMAFLVRRGLPRSTHNMWNGPRCKCALQLISPHEDGAVICPACLRDHRPLASMKSAKQVAGSRGRALCASRVSACPVSGFRPVVHRLLCTLPAGGCRAARLGGPPLMRRQALPRFLLGRDKLHLWSAMPRSSGRFYWRGPPPRP